MNFNLYLFGSKNGNYNQYPDDYTSSLLKSFCSDVSYPKAMIVRKADLMYYIVAESIGKEHVNGICLVFNKAYFKDVNRLFRILLDINSSIYSEQTENAQNYQSEITNHNGWQSSFEYVKKRIRHELESRNNNLGVSDLTTTYNGNNQSKTIESGGYNSEIIKLQQEFNIIIIDYPAKTVTHATTVKSGRSTEYIVGTVFFLVLICMLLSAFIPFPQKNGENVDSVVAEDNCYRYVVDTVKSAGIAIVPDEEAEEIKSQDEMKEDERATGAVDEDRGVDDVINAQEHKDVVVVEEKPEHDDNYVFDAVEQNASFPGGDRALLEWIGSHMNYPQVALDYNVQGTVRVRFVVKKDGTIGDVSVLSPVDPALDKEAMRVVKTLPKFIPGKMDGHAVDCYFTVPIQFRLVQSEIQLSSKDSKFRLISTTGSLHTRAFTVRYYSKATEIRHFTIKVIVKESGKLYAEKSVSNILTSGVGSFTVKFNCIFFPSETYIFEVWDGNTMIGKSAMVY